MVGNTLSGSLGVDLLAMAEEPEHPDYVDYGWRYECSIEGFIDKVSDVCGYLKKGSSHHFHKYCWVEVLSETESPANTDQAANGVQRVETIELSLSCPFDEHIQITLVNTHTEDDDGLEDVESEFYFCDSEGHDLPTDSKAYTYLMRSFWYSDMQDVEISTFEEALAAIHIEHRGTILDICTEKLRSNKELVLLALAASPFDWTYVDDDLKFDQDVLNAAIDNPLAPNSYYTVDLSEAPEALKDDRDLILRLSEKKAGQFFLASESLLSDPKFVASAISKNPNIVLEWDWRSGDQITDDIKNDPLIVSVMNERKFWIGLVGELFLEYIPESLKADRDLITQALKANGNNWYNVPDELKVDRAVIEAAVASGDSLTSMMRDFPDAIRDDEEIVRQRLLAREHEFTEISDRLKNDKPFLLDLIREKPSIINVVGFEWWDDEEIIESAISGFESSTYGFPGGGDWFLSRSIDWVQNNPEIIRRLQENTMSEYLSDEPDLELEDITEENYEYQSFVLICKLLDAFGLKDIDPVLVMNDSEEDGWAGLRLGSICLGHKTIMKSVQASFGMHFDVLSSISLDEEDFLNDNNPSLSSAVQFVSETVNDPESSFNQRHEE